MPDARSLIAILAIRCRTVCRSTLRVTGRDRSHLDVTARHRGLQQRGWHDLGRAEDTDAQATHRSPRWGKNILQNLASGRPTSVKSRSDLTNLPSETFYEHDFFEPYDQARRSDESARG